MRRAIANSIDRPGQRQVESEELRLAKVYFGLSRLCGFQGELWLLCSLAGGDNMGGMKKHPSKRHPIIVQAYQRNLHQVRGLSPKTCQDRLRDVRGFLEAVAVRQAVDLADLAPTRLVSYLSAQSAHYQPASLRNVASSVRDFLRFARQQGWTSGPQESGRSQDCLRGTK